MVFVVGSHMEVHKLSKVEGGEKREKLRQKDSIFTFQWFRALLIGFEKKL